MTYTNESTTKTQFNHNADDGRLICRHRDLSCCDACAAAHEEIVDVYGAHFWIADAAEREAMIAMVS